MGLLRQLKTANILKELRPRKGQQAAILYFPELIHITEGKNSLLWFVDHVP